MKDYYNVLPDRVNLLTKHYTPGRGGQRIQKVTLHHTAGVLDADSINKVWWDRPASAHYLVDPQGVVSQHVWDRDTAWSNANWHENITSITIEHSNSAGPAQDWPINPITRTNGARLVAALCRFYGLGRPQADRNVTFHFRFTGTSCPYHLRPGHKYHAEYMREAQRFYDHLVHPALATPALQPKQTRKGLFMHLTKEQELEILEGARAMRELRNAFLEPTPSIVPGSTFQAPRVDFIDLIDRKVEELHQEMLQRQSAAQAAAEEIQRQSDEHDPAVEAKHHAHDEGEA